jgi:hypothetical protein
MRINFIMLLALIASTDCTPGQQVLPVRELVYGGLVAIDDVVVSQTGDLFLSFPQQNLVAQETMTPTGVVWTPVATGLVLAMELEPSGLALWTADYVSGDVSRVDLATGQVTQTLTGFGYPIDLSFKDANTLLVGGLSTPDNIGGVGTVYEVNLLAAPGTPPVPLATGFIGALDVVSNAQGRLFVVSMSSSQLSEIDVQTGAVTPILGNLFQPADMVPGPGNSIYICTLLAGEVIRVNPDPAGIGITHIDAPVGGMLGPGCEDMAFDPDGQLLVTLTNGELYRLLLQNAIVKEGYGIAGSSFLLVVKDATHAAWSYQLMASFGTGSLPIPGVGSLPIGMDLLFLESLNASSPFFSGFSGVLDPQGRAVGTVYVPPLPSGVAFDLYFGVGIFDLSGATPQIILPDFIRTPVLAL